MNSHSLDVLVPPVVAFPRGAQWAADAVVFVIRAVRRLKRGDEPRSPAELLELARRVEREMPALAAELRFIAMHRPLPTP